MTLKLTLLLLIITIQTWGRQNSSIDLDSGNNNSIRVTQESKDSLLKSSVKIRKGDSNIVDVHQKKVDSIKTDNSPGFENSVDNTEKILTIIVSCITIAVAIWKGISYYKKRRAKK